MRRFLKLCTFFSLFSISCCASQAEFAFCLKTKNFKKDFYKKGTCIGTCLKEERPIILKKMRLAECLCVFCIAAPVTAGCSYAMLISASAGARAGFYVGGCFSGIISSCSTLVIAKTCKDLKEADHNAPAQIPMQIRMPPSTPEPRIAFQASSESLSEPQNSHQLQ